MENMRHPKFNLQGKSSKISAWFAPTPNPSPKTFGGGELIYKNKLSFRREGGTKGGRGETKPHLNYEIRGVSC